MMTSGGDIKVAQATYDNFIKVATWGTAICLVVVAIVVGLISS